MSQVFLANRFMCFMNEKIQGFYFSFFQKLVLSISVIFLTAFSAIAQTPQATPPPQTPQQQQQRQEQPQPDRPQTTQPNRQTQQQVPLQPKRQKTAQPNQPQANPNVPNAPLQTPNQSVGTSGGIAPAQLPDDPPPIAPNFEAPPRPLPSAERVGVDVSNQLPLSLQDAITLALQNNNDIDSSKIDVQIAEFNLRGARGVYDPVINSENYYERRTTPVASTIGGGANGSVTQTSL